MAARRLIPTIAISAAVALLAAGAASARSGESAIADAAMAGHRDAVRSLLENAADVNAAQGDGMTALHWAARHGDVELARMLLYAGANVKASTRLGGYTPLLMAAEAGDAAMIAALLEAGADPKTATTNGTTPLMLAAASGSAEAVRKLLAGGADLHATEHAREQTALMFASAFNRVEAMRVLLENGARTDVTTKVIDLKAQTNPEEEAYLRAQQQRQGETGRAARPAGAAEPRASEPSAGTGVPAESAASGGRSAAPPAQAQAGGRAAQQDQEEEKKAEVPGLTRQFRYAELVSTQGGLTPLLLAARHGHAEAVTLLLEAGAAVNQVSAGDATSALLMAVINGHFDLAKLLLERGADPRLASENGVTPLYAALNVQWAPKTWYPQPRAHLQQQLTHLDLMRLLLARGVDVNARLKKKVWYSGYNSDLSGVDEIGATPFWRAAYACDVEAMRLLVASGADPHIPTMRPAGRPRTGDGGRQTTQDVSGLPPVPVGGPAVTALHAATGVGYAEGFAANSHRISPGGWMRAVRYLVEDLGADVNERDHEGNTALHHAAARGDNEMILYLVSKGADVMAVNRAGETTVDMANGPVERTQPFPETIALLEKMGAKNNHRCKSC
jgi:ankyrin repeat protein